MQLRAARRGDIPTLRAWDREDHVRAAGISGWDWEEMLSTDPDWRDLLIAELGGQPIGFLQIMDPARDPSRYWGECGPDLRALDIWIGDADRLGQGHGTEMMRQALDWCFADPAVRAVIIDPLTSNTKAHRFYERLGFAFVEQRRFDADDCSIFELTRADWRPGA